MLRAHISNSSTDNHTASPDDDNEASKQGSFYFFLSKIGNKRKLPQDGQHISLTPSTSTQSAKHNRGMVG